MEEWELRRQITSYYYYCYSTPTEMFSMHIAHVANVSKSVTKNATFPRTGGLPCLITRQLHVCCISYSCWGTHFLYLSNPPAGIPVPIIPCWELKISIQASQLVSSWAC